MDFYAAVKERRSIYGISKEKVVPDERIQTVISEALKHNPSPFNAQMARVIVLLNGHHDRLWDVVKEALRKIVPAANFSETEQRIKGFKSGYGTVLFFEDLSVVENLQKQYPLYKENFPLWSVQSLGMLQYIVWTALEVEGFGASLQHYNPLIDQEVKEIWNVPEGWKLNAELPFGKPTAGPMNKDFMPLDERMRFLK